MEDIFPLRYDTSTHLLLMTNQSFSTDNTPQCHWYNFFKHGDKIEYNKKVSELFTFALDKSKLFPSKTSENKKERKIIMNLMKFMGGTLALGAIAALVTGIIMKKNGKLDEFVEKFKQKKEFCNLTNEGFMEKNACMVSH